MRGKAEQQTHPNKATANQTGIADRYSDHSSVQLLQLPSTVLDSEATEIPQTSVNLRIQTHSDLNTHAFIVNPKLI